MCWLYRWEARPDLQSGTQGGSGGHGGVAFFLLLLSSRNRGRFALCPLPNHKLPSPVCIGFEIGILRNTGREDIGVPPFQ